MQPREVTWDLLLQTNPGARVSVTAVCFYCEHMPLKGREGELSWASQQLPCRLGAAGKAAFCTAL